MRASLPAETYWKLRAAYSDVLAATLCPTTAVTVTLNQSRSYETPRGKVWRRGDIILFEGVLEGLMKRLAQQVYGRRATEKHGLKLIGAGIVEGNGTSKAFHIHACLRRPDHLTPEQFNRCIIQSWSESPWLKPDLDVQEINGGWCWYMTKEGPDGLALP
jgi:hypothetical protein